MLKNMVALVTGAAGSLGSATCKKLISEGCHVAMIDLPSSKGNELAESLGKNALYIPADVTSEEEVLKAVEVIRKEHGKLHILVNCASLVMSKVLFNVNQKRACDLNRILNSLTVNVGGTLNVVRLALDLMVDNPMDSDNLRGVIINTSGFAAFEGMIGHSMMAASWGAISSLTLPLCRELGPAGIRVMGIAPGLMASNLTDMIKPRVQKGLSMFIPSPKRFGYPDEYASLVVNIVQNKYLNGEIIRLDAGLRVNIS